MKRIFAIWMLFISTAAVADTHDITFMIDNNIYHTTTCTIGNGVSVPNAPEKYGHDFTGWQPIYYRGTFETWNDIPTTINSYIADANGSYTPMENDYIIINNASDVPELNNEFEIQVSTDKYGWEWTNYCRTIIDGVDYGCNGTIYGGILTVSPRAVVGGNVHTTWLSDTNDILFKDKIYPIGNFFSLLQDPKNNGTHVGYFINDFPYSGKWMLRYRGNWDVDNRSGWYAVKKMD